MKELKLQEVTTCKPDDNSKKVAELFTNNDVRHVVVEDDGKPVGIISTYDLTAKVVAKNLSPESVMAKEVMNSPVDYVDINQEVEFAMKIMLQHKTYNCLVCENDKIKGMISYKQAMDEIVKKMTDRFNSLKEIWNKISS